MEEKKRSGKILVIVLAGFMAALVLLAAATMIVVLRENRSSASSGERIVSESLEAKLGEIRKLLDQYYLFDAETEEEIDFDTAILKGYVDALGDPYTVYYTPEEFADLLESNSGKFSGIGAVLQQDPETMKIKIVRPFRNSPAAKAGLMAGDELVSVNGEKLTDEEISLVVARIRGDQGTSVELTVRRESSGEILTFTIIRDEVEVDSAYSEMLDNNIGYLTIESFDEVTYGQFLEAYTKLQAEGMEALIIDLRDNGGGLVSSVCAISDFLLPEGTLTYTIDKNGNREEYVSDASDHLDVPCVLLVNGNTASASEIMTGALKHYEKATVIGETTFGKGIVQSIISLPDKSGIKITVSRYYTPDDVCIHEIGIEPDIEVANGVETEEDEQLDAAIEYLKKQKNNDSES